MNKKILITLFFASCVFKLNAMNHNNIQAPIIPEHADNNQLVYQNRLEEYNNSIKKQETQSKRFANFKNKKSNRDSRLSSPRTILNITKENHLNEIDNNVEERLDIILNYKGQLNSKRKQTLQVFLDKTKEIHEKAKIIDASLQNFRK
jgi:hypothetical protein